MIVSIVSLDMDATRWRQVRSLLHEALELAPERRAAFLDEACGADSGLRAEIESLLAASAQPAIIDRPAAGATLTMEIGPSLLKPGQLVSHYEIVEKIGEGGMGEVYKAIDTRLDRVVALKIILDADDDWQRRRRFEREAKAASALNHPNIVTIYEFNRDNGLDFIAMEYVDGVTLDKLLHEPMAKLMSYARQAAAAIAKAHSAGIVHRDLKPQNIIVTADGTAKVLDFGLAKQAEFFGDADATRTQLTKIGAIAGTPAYMSPEQVLGGAVGPSADIFSFGIVLYELACRTRPFAGTTALATLNEVAHKEPPSPGGSVPAELAALIKKCLDKKPAERPASMTEVVAALTDIESALRSRREPGIGRRGWIAGSALGAAVLAAGLWFGFRPPAPLTYSIEAQKKSAGQPVGEPYAASANDIFEGGWDFRLHIQAPRAGSLYVVNKGPDQSGADRFYILYHAPAGAAHTVETRWFKFDQNPGTEQLWLVWSAQPLALLEDEGSVTSQAAAAAIDRLLASTDGSRRVELLRLKHR